MLRVAVKGLGQFALGAFPGGEALYRKITWEWMGTHATHVDKLQRVLPGYLDVWRNRCGLDLDGARIWIHEPGPTPFWAFTVYALTGRGATLTGDHVEPMDRYLARAARGVVDLDISLPADRVRSISGLRWAENARTAMDTVDARIGPPDRADLCHSGGALEHLSPPALDRFLQRCFDGLRPGGIASHVFDHRDHLHHADPRLPFLFHLAIPSPIYRLARPPFPAHNRLAPSQVAALFESVGFEPIALRRLILPDRIYVEGDAALRGDPGLSRCRLAPEFADIDELDLRTAAAHYVYRRPI
jgi:SAM-dependent methyltransferase